MDADTQRVSDDPYALRPGFDYHLAEAVRRESGWAAVCNACGFEGRSTSKEGAEQDCLAHDTTHNPG